jgi:hypothetical protein
MARGKSFLCMCTRQEVFEALSEVSDKWYGLLETFPPVQYHPFNLAEVQNAEYDRDIALRLFLRTSPYSISNEAKFDTSHAIPEGLISIDLPGFFKSKVDACLILAGSADPKDGIPSPLKTFGKLKARLSKRLIPNNTVNVMPWGEVRCTEGGLALYEAFISQQ